MKRFLFLPFFQIALFLLLFSLLFILHQKAVYAAQFSVSGKAVTVIGGSSSSGGSNCNLYSLERGVGQYGIDWTDAEKANIPLICQDITKSPSAYSKFQKAGQIHLQKYSSGYLGKGVCGLQATPDIVEIACDMTSPALAQYVILHESGHVLASFNGDVYQAYLNSGAFDQEGENPTYPFSEAGILSWGGCPKCESFAESVSDYITSKIYNFPPRSWSGYPGGPWKNPGSGWTTFSQDRPVHYNFFKNSVFGGVEY